METKLNSLRQIIEKLLARIDKASETNDISMIETDIMLQLLRQAYVETEELKMKGRISESHKAPVVQVVQPPMEDRQPHEDQLPHMVQPSQQDQQLPEVHQSSEASPDVHQSYEVHQAPEGQQSQEVAKSQEIPKSQEVQQPQEVQTQQPEVQPVQEPEPPVTASAAYVAPAVNLSQEPEVIVPSPVNIDEVPKMSFPQVEISLETPFKKEEIKLPPVTALEQFEQSSVTTPPIDRSAEAQSHQAPDTHMHSTPEFKQPQFETPTPRPVRHETDLFTGPTIADKLKSDTPSLNERIIQGRDDQSLAHKMQLKPISDLRTAIGINEKFQFVNDLFEGRIELYNEAISSLNNCNSGIVADNILFDLRMKHNWKEDTDAYGKLKNFIVRRYM